MLTGEIRRQIDDIWNDFWTGGVSNPLSVIEQITYLLFIKRLDELETNEENKSSRTGKPMERRLFPQGKDRIGKDGGCRYADMRWSRFKTFEPRKMFEIVDEHVFPFLRTLGGNGSLLSQHMRDARNGIPTPALLAKVVDKLSAIQMEDRDTKGDVYEYMLGKIASAGQNGQFRTPRHIIALMVELVAPSPKDTICDPAVGTAGFLVTAGEYLRREHKEIFRDAALRRHFHEKMFTGFDFDATMLRIAAMNMVLHGIEHANIVYRDSLSENNADAQGLYSVVLANPPFAGSLDTEQCAKNLQQVVKTKKTELLFLALFLRLLKIGGRAAVIVPDGVLFGSSTAHKTIRKILVEDHKLDAVIKLPSGVFRPYAGVSTAILVFTKTGVGGTENVWFYDVQADGRSLDDKRQELLPPEKLGATPKETLEPEAAAKNNLPDIVTRWKDAPPHIAVSVDMLDTGIDVPEVVNLVFFKIARSRTKFWQMIGRGTRLCPNLFGPGRHKEFFHIFDFCQNFEFFNQNPPMVDGAAADSLTKKLFVQRVELIGEIDGLNAPPEKPDAHGLRDRAPTFRHESDTGESMAPYKQLRAGLAERLQEEVAGMSLDNFLVRPKRKSVERFAKPDSWATLTYDARTELADEVAGLPSSFTDDDTAAKEFDLLILKTQLAILRSEKRLDRLRKQIVDLCGILEELTNVPAVAKQLELIHEVQTDEYWEDITAPTLETVRRRIRDLIKLIEWTKRPLVYSDFEDDIGPGSEIALEGAAVGTDMAKFRMKARHFLREHMDHLAIQKLRRNEPLTITDLSELERMFVTAGIADNAVIDRLRGDGGLGIFIRSLVGLDREAAKQAFSTFLADKTLSANQIEFVDMIVDHLTERGIMEPSLLYESPFTDLSPLGVEGVLGKDRAGVVIHILDDIRCRAAA